MRSLSAYFPGFAKALVFMLQSTEYRVLPYLKWLYRVEDFRMVARRRELVMTSVAKLLLLSLRLAVILHILAGLALLIWGIQEESLMWIFMAIAWLSAYPFLWSHLIVVPLWLAEKTVIKQKQTKAIHQAGAIFSKHPGVKIAIAGSYGKTSMKEILATVLGQAKKVAATPGNQNVSRSHVKFAKRLSGEEDIILIEYGEEKPGDIKMFMGYTHPDIAVITGLAPNHLDFYKSLDNIAKDLLELTRLKSEKVFVNGDNQHLKQRFKGVHFYDVKEVLGWKITDIKVAVDHTSFVMKKGKKSLKLKSKLIGVHQVGPVVLAVALADQFGLTLEQIKQGVSDLEPIGHRMQPRHIGGAWIIDDSYNGNIEGLKSGLEFLRELKTTGRKIYVTPGLVTQGSETPAIHLELGKYISSSNPDEVVLMENSVAKFIKQGLEIGGYEGKLTLQDDPLAFYSSLEQYIASGDILLMQNDWTDNYN